MSTESQTEPPWLWIVTGPNGAGKSSLRQHLRKDLADLPWLNPDEIAIKFSEEHNVSYDDGLRSLYEEMPRLIKELSDANQSFIVETTTPGLTYNKLATDLKEKGWKIGVISINVASPDIAIDRVHDRINRGGHPATDEGTAIRWKQCIERLHFILPLSDVAFVYDNTLPEHKLVASGNDGRLHMETIAHPSSFITNLEEVLRNNNLLAQTGTSAPPPIQ